MLVVLFTVIAVVTAFLSGVFVGALNTLGVQRAVRSLRELPRTRRMACDICHEVHRCVDRTIDGGAGGVAYCWAFRACTKRMRAQDDARRSVRERIEDLGFAEDDHEPYGSPVAAHPDDIPF